MTDVLSTKNVLRLIQSIPSPKAEPFKMWLAQVGNDRLEEYADPEKAITRGAEYYRAKGLKAVSSLNAKDKKLLEIRKEKRQE